MRDKHLAGTATGCSNIISMNVSQAHESAVAVANINSISFSGTLGDAITVNMGYTGDTSKVFSGYVKRVEKSSPDGIYTITANDALVRAVDFFIVSTNPEHGFTYRNISAENLIAEVLGMAGLSSFDFDTTYFTFGINSPQQLGVDRWMGLIAARQRTRVPTLVVSVGTAMTVDALAADGMFLGGLIVPGVAMMRQALHQGTARVAEVAGTWREFPQSTAEAVESGIVAALCGAIQLQHARLAETAGLMPHCILTGGDADKLLPHLAMAVEHAPALVLEGIDCVAREGTAG